ncbi:MAG: S8 family peptidase [Sphingopyxis solisilvae]|uniref:S8 family peptidase n=1 Tax=Sphingopyxis solisilvae TaxID=1886788 RepID=UPI004035C725
MASSAIPFLLDIGTGPPSLLTSANGPISFRRRSLIGLFMRAPALFLPRTSIRRNFSRIANGAFTRFQRRRTMVPSHDRMRDAAMAETESYIVVEDVQGAQGGTLQRGLLDAKAQDSAAEKLNAMTIQVAELTPREARAIDNSPLMIAAELMPTRLLHGLAREGYRWIESRGEIVPRAADGALEIGWGIAEIGAAGEIANGELATVAMLDTGIAAHSAFHGIDIVSEDFTQSATDDRNGHGTHCAGTIFGRDCFGHRIGVARAVPKAYVAKVLDDDGRGTSDGLLRGIKWALDHHADVISISIGYDFPGMVKSLTDRGMPVDLATSRTLVAYRHNLRAFDAVMSLARALAGSEGGSVILAATGNESRADIDPRYRVDATLPASAQDVIGVAAAERRDGALRIADFSNGAPILSAPGVDIVSAARDERLARMSGTSMACPHAAGVAALWWDWLRKNNGHATARQVAAQLSVTAKPKVFSPGFTRAAFGDGLVTAP